MLNSDQYWLNICNDIGANSKCLSHKYGAVITNDNKFIIATGYNGPPSKCKHCDDQIYREYLFNLMWKDLKTSNIYNKHPIFPIKQDIDYSKCPRKIAGFSSGEGIQYCQGAHAERNAISIAAKLGHSIDNGIMYLNTPISCFECAKSIINAGIKEVVVTKLENYEKSGITGRFLFEQTGIEIREYNLDA